MADDDGALDAGRRQPGADRASLRRRRGGVFRQARGIAVTGAIDCNDAKALRRKPVAERRHHVRLISARAVDQDDRRVGRALGVATGEMQAAVGRIDEGSARRIGALESAGLQV